MCVDCEHIKKNKNKKKKTRERSTVSSQHHDQEEGRGRRMKLFDFSNTEEASLLERYPAQDAAGAGAGVPHALPHHVHHHPHHQQQRAAGADTQAEPYTFSHTELLAWGGKPSDEQLLTTVVGNPLMGGPNDVVAGAGAVGTPSASGIAASHMQQQQQQHHQQIEQQRLEQQRLLLERQFHERAREALHVHWGPMTYAPQDVPSSVEGLNHHLGYTTSRAPFMHAMAPPPPEKPMLHGQSMQMMPRLSAAASTLRKRNTAPIRRQPGVPHSEVEKQRRDRMNSIVDELRPIVPMMTGAVETQDNRRAKHEVLSDAVDYILSLEMKLGQHATKIDALERRTKMQDMHIKEMQIRDASRAAEVTVKTMQEAAEQAGVRIKCHCHAEPMEGSVADGDHLGGAHDDLNEKNLGEEGVEDDMATTNVVTPAATAGNTDGAGEEWERTEAAIGAGARGTAGGVAAARDNARTEAHKSAQTSVVFEFEEDTSIAAPAVHFVVNERSQKTYMNIKCADRRGLLSDIMKVTARLPMQVRAASVVTHPDGTVDDNFEVVLDDPTQPFEALEKMFVKAYGDVTAAATLLGDKRARPMSPPR